MEALQNTGIQFLSETEMQQTKGGNSKRDEPGLSGLKGMWYEFVGINRAANKRLADSLKALRGN